MKNKIQEKVLKEIDIVAKKELRKWLDDGGTIEEYICKEYGNHLEKAISRTRELMEEERQNLVDDNKEYWLIELEKQKADFRKMIEDFEFTNIIRMNSNLGADTTQDRIKDELLAKLNDEEARLR